MEQKKQIIVWMLVLIFVGAGSFYGGTVYESSKNSPSGMGGKNDRNDRFAQSPGQPAHRFPPRPDGGNNSSGPLSGKITAKDDQSITVKIPDGSTKIIYFSESTTIGKAVEGSATDLETGKSVMINGKSNADGSFTAQNIQIRSDIAPREK